MRCSRCDMLLSPTKTSCPRCGISVIAGGKRQEVASFAFTQAPFEQRKYSGFAGTAVEVAPIQHTWEPQTRNAQETPFTVAPTPRPQAPLLSELEDAQISMRDHKASALATPSAFPKTGYHTTFIGFGLAGLCTGLACLLLVFVYVIAQTLPQTSSSSSPRLNSGSLLVAQNTPAIHPSPTTTAAIASPTATYPGQQYITNAQTAIAINFANEQPTLPTNIFRVGQKIYITFDVQPNGHTGAVCLLWYINATQFASYPFAINTITPTAAYSYAATSSVGQGRVEIYWENTPSCIDPNKILSDSVNFTITA